MNEEHHPMKWIILAAIILLLLLGGAWLLSRKKTSAPTDTDTLTSNFSPFDRPVTSRVIDTSVPDNPYTQPTPVTQIPEPTPTQPSPPTVVNVSSPSQEPFVSREATYRQSFNIPTREPDAPAVTYSETPAPSTPTYTSYTMPVYTPATAPSTTVSVLVQNEEKGSKGFNELDKQVFGYVTGLGWTQLLGKTGQQVFDFLYLLTPQGSTGATLGKLLGVGQGSPGGIGGVAGFGAGGSTLMNFGGQVTYVTYCTCSASIMLNINDVRGQMLSLIYQPGASKLYADYNVTGIGQNVLGNYVSGGSCLVYHGEDCTTEGNAQGTITQIGTSP